MCTSCRTKEKLLMSVLREYELPDVTTERVECQFHIKLPQTKSRNTLIAHMHESASPSRPRESITISLDSNRSEDTGLINSPPKFLASSVQRENTLKKSLQEMDGPKPQNNGQV